MAKVRTTGSSLMGKSSRATKTKHLLASESAVCSMETYSKPPSTNVEDEMEVMLTAISSLRPPEDSTVPEATTKTAKTHAPRKVKQASPAADVVAKVKSYCY
jgi:hypothetical protein